MFLYAAPPVPGSASKFSTSTSVCPLPQAAGEEHDSPTDSTRSRSLRRTVSVPSEGQFPEFSAEGSATQGRCVCVCVCVCEDRASSVCPARCPRFKLRGLPPELQGSGGCGHRLLPPAQSWADWAGLVHSGIGLGCGCSLCWLLLSWLSGSDCSSAPPPHLTEVMMSLMMSLIAGLCRRSRLRFPIMLQASRSHTHTLDVQHSSVRLHLSALTQ